MGEPIRLPNSIPPQAVALQGLRIAKGGQPSDPPCFLAFHDRDGVMHEVRIPFRDMLEILNFLNETGRTFPLQVRYDA